MRGVKIALAGDAGCGKSSLLTRFIGNDFLDDIRPTEGVSLSQKQLLDPYYLRGAFFDSSAVLPDEWLVSYYGKTNVVMLCVDLQLATAALEASVRQQLAKMDHLAPETSIVLIGTKTDLVIDRHLLAKNKEKLREITENNEKVQAAFITSAKDSKNTIYNAVLCNKVSDIEDSAGYEHVFNAIISIAVSPKQSKQREEIPELAFIPKKLETIYEETADSMNSEQESCDNAAQSEVDAIKDKQISKADLGKCLKKYSVFHVKQHKVIIGLTAELAKTPDDGFVDGAKLYTLFSHKVAKINTRLANNPSAKATNDTEKVIEEICTLATPKT